MSRPTRQYIFDLDDRRYRLRGTELEQLERETEVVGDQWIVSDFEGAAPQVMTVDAPVQYAEAVIEKRLRDQGGMVGGGRILALRRHRRSARVTEALFVNVPAARYAHYAAAAEDDACHQLLFALPGLLAVALTKLRAKKPVVVMLVHDRHVDTVVGSANRTYGAFRASSHRVGGDTARLVENLADGVRRIEQENNIKVTAVHGHFWRLGASDDAAWTAGLARELGIPWVQPTMDRLHQDGQYYDSSVPSLLAKLTIADSVSTPMQKGLFRAQVLLPWAAAALVAITLLALLVSAEWRRRTDQLLVASAKLEAAQSPPEPGPAVLKAAYEKPLQLADTLGRAQIAPPFRSVLAQVSASASGEITFDEVVIEYPEAEAKVALMLVGQSGTVGEGEGVPVFNAFLTALRQRGFTLVNSELKTEVDAFSFLIQLERGLQ